MFDLLQGTLDMLILKTLLGERKHGFRIAARIKQVSANILTVDESSLDLALHRLERRGWIASSLGVWENTRRAKFYRLTAKANRRR